MTILKEMIVRYETDGHTVKGFDAGELIRCKDCEFSSPNPRVQSIHRYICEWHDMTVFGHYYCGSAEKRKENDHQG